MTDNRLVAIIDAARVLDDPNVSREAAAKVSQLCSILAQSLNPDGLPVGDGAPEWPDPVIKAVFDLAMSTATYADSVSWPSDTEWWRDYRARMVSDWGAARRTAELLAYGEIRAATLVALDSAEKRVTTAEPLAEPLTKTVACDDVTPPLLSAMTAQEAFDRGWPIVPSQEPGHAAL